MPRWRHGCDRYSAFPEANVMGLNFINMMGLICMFLERDFSTHLWMKVNGIKNHWFYYGLNLWWSTWEDSLNWDSSFPNWSWGMESMRLWHSMGVWHNLIVRDGKYEVMAQDDCDGWEVWGYGTVWLWGMESMRVWHKITPSTFKDARSSAPGTSPRPS